jgi:hypothetical protein
MRRLLPLFVLGLGVAGGGAASASEWAFSEVVIDQQPFAEDRVNDLALGDLNGDGRLDIWLSGRDGEGHQAAWYANPGEREAPWQRFTLIEGAWKYGALGDLDGDGDLDIAAGFNTDEKVYWLENDGSPEDGGWTRHFLGLTGTPDQVFAQDMDGDGALEVIAAFKDGPVVILRRPADPRQPWHATSIVEDAEDVAGASIGDIDGDGDPDVVFGNAWYENPLPQGDLAEGAWRGRTIDGEWPKEARSVVADIDRDGRNDVVLSGEESDAGVAWYRSPEPRSGAWQKTVVTDDYSGVHSLAVGDFNDDGRPDILAAEMHTSPSRRVSLFEQGARPDQWREHVLATVGAHNARIADLDGDGRLDIAGKNFEDDMRSRVWFNDFDPDQLGLDQWRRKVIETELPHQATSIRTGDLNGDGLPDLAAGAWWWANPGRIGGDWQRQPIGEDLQNLAVLHDFDGDDDLDALGSDGTPDGDAFFWAENDGTGGFTERSVGPRADGDFLQGVAVGDLLGDGSLQVVLSWHDGQRTDPLKGSQWFRVPADPQGDWVWEKIHDFSSEEQIDLGDIDGDGDLDIHMGSAWLRNDGDGRFTHQPAVVLSGGDVDRVRLADIDGDDDLDVVIGAEHAKRLVWGEHPGGDGRGVWREHLIAEDFRHMSVDVGDLAGDLDVDVVSGEHQGRGRVTIYQNDGAGAAWTRQVVDAGSASDEDDTVVGRALELIGLSEPEAMIDHHNGTRLVDLDGDGDLDIVSLGWTPASVVVYENLSGGQRGLRADLRQRD